MRHDPRQVGLDLRELSQCLGHEAAEAGGEVGLELEEAGAKGGADSTLVRRGTADGEIPAADGAGREIDDQGPPVLGFEGALGVVMGEGDAGNS